MSSTDEAASPKRGQTLQILLWVFGALLLMAFLTYAITALLASSRGQASFWTAYEHPQFSTLLRSAIPAAGLLAAGSAGAVAILRQRSLESTYQLDRDRHQLDRDRHQLDRDRHQLDQSRGDGEVIARLRDRYAAAAAQLGNSAAAVRLAGVYATASLADDWLARNQRSEAQVCVDLLCAYFRLPHLSDHAEAEREVRQTITRVIAAHLQNLKDASSWCGLDLDFTGAKFYGNHSFAGAKFTGGQAIFTRAEFVEGKVLFDLAEFDQVLISFTHADFSGGTVSFYEANMAGGTLSFVGARFSGGTVSFQCTNLNGSHISLSETLLEGGAVSFDAARFNAGNTSFAYAELTEGALSFKEAEFHGGSLNSREAKFNIEVPGPWSLPRPPEVYPPNQ